MYERVSDFDYDGWLDDSEAVQYQDQIVGEIVPEEVNQIFKPFRGLNICRSLSKTVF